MNDIVNDKKGHNIVNDIMNDTVNDRKGSQYCEWQTALLISQTAYLVNRLEWFNFWDSHVKLYFPFNVITSKQMSTVVSFKYIGKKSNNA